MVDAEEDFAWDGPLAPDNLRTTSIRAQRKAHEIFAYYGVHPTYLTSWPLASDPFASGMLREWRESGICDIGAHLHPWVTPPFGGDRAEAQSFPGNLAMPVEREKLSRLLGEIETNIDIRPTIYRAGRYGFGPNTAALLRAEGFLIDTSLIPRTTYAAVGGPNFSDYDYAPFWFGGGRSLLELPVTRALTGALAMQLPGLYRGFERKVPRAMKMGSLFARSGLLERITLSPEGNTLEEMCRLTRVLLARGQRVLTLNYHSPSLAPGNTPYVRTTRDLAIFLDRLSGFLAFFQNEIGGEFLTPHALRDRLFAPDPPASVAIARPERHAAAAFGAQRCLVVANTFPPMHGGSAVVYDSLGRFGGGRVSVLAPREDYRDGWPIPSWREYDHSAPYPIHRVRLLRTQLTSEHLGVFRRIAVFASDLAIRLGVLRTIGRIVKAERISVLCIGELVAGGWLARICPLLFGVKTVIYVHGEEVSTRTPYDLDGRRRRRSLASADGIVAVSRFTKDTLLTGFDLEPDKIALISNGVDANRFRPHPKRPDLIERYRIAGKKVVLTVGRLYARKGMDRVIEALPEIRRVIPDVVYLIVGEGAYRSTLTTLAVQNGVADVVIFAGDVPDNELADHYALADVFIMANREMPDGDTEGFGLVFLEANACGKPVVAGEAGGSGDAVRHKENGLVVDGNDCAMILDAVVELLHDPALCAGLIANGFECARQSGWSGRVDQFLRYCDRLTDA